MVIVQYLLFESGCTFQGVGLQSASLETTSHAKFLGSCEGPRVPVSCFQASGSRAQVPSTSTLDLPKLPTSVEAPKCQNEASEAKVVCISGGLGKYSLTPDGPFECRPS